MLEGRNKLQRERRESFPQFLRPWASQKSISSAWQPREEAGRKRLQYFQEFEVV